MNEASSVLPRKSSDIFGKRSETIVCPSDFTAVKRLGTRVNTRVIYAPPVTFPLPPTKFPRSTSATRAISVLSSIILPLQTFFSRVLLLRQQPFSSENLPPERPMTTIAIKTQVFMFRYELVNSTRKFTIVAEIVSLLKKIYKRDAPLRAVFKGKTLAVLFSPYPREMKHIPRNSNLPPFWRLLVSIEMVQSIPTRALSRARGLSMRTHLTAVDLRTGFGKSSEIFGKCSEIFGKSSKKSLLVSFYLIINRIAHGCL